MSVWNNLDEDSIADSLPSLAYNLIQTTNHRQQVASLRWNLFECARTIRKDGARRILLDDPTE